MFKEIGWAILCFFIAYLAFEGVFYLLEKDYGIKLPIAEEFFLSYDGGDEWLAIEVPDNKVVTSGALSFDPENPQRLYLASPRGIFYRDEGSKTKFQKTEAKFETENAPLLISQTITSPHSDETIYIISEDIERNKVLVSYNKGEIFRPIFISQIDDKISAFSVDPFYPNVLYVGTRLGNFLKSEDFGNSWGQKDNFIQEVGQISPNPHTRNEIYLLLSRRERDLYDYYSQLMPSKIMVSINGGTKFRELSSKIVMPETRKIVFDPIINRVYFFSDLSLIRKEGEKIKIVNVVKPSFDNKIKSFTIDPQNSNILYVGADNLIYKSEDGGNNWQIIESPVRGDVKEIKINPEDSQTLIISIEKTL
ncbi:MAG: hypothetical protein V1841_00380 [Patescibacteria group bacterium]